MQAVYLIYEQMINFRFKLKAVFQSLVRLQNFFMHFNCVRNVTRTVDVNIRSDRGDRERGSTISSGDSISSTHSLKKQLEISLHISVHLCV